MSSITSEASATPLKDLVKALALTDEASGFSSDKPKSTANYIICMLPRTGSTMICSIMEATGVLGYPDEYLNPRGVVQMYAKRYRPTDLHSYVDVIRRERATGNGIFGMKVTFDDLKPVADALLIKELFSPVKFIYLQRQNLILQAVSAVIAEQSGVWHRDAKGGVYRSGIDQPRPVAFDEQAIVRKIDEYTRMHANWERFFAIHSINPLRINYEQFLADIDGTTRALAHFVGVILAGNIDVTMSATSKLADATSLEWAARLRTKYRERIVCSNAENGLIEKVRADIKAGRLDEALMGLSSVPQGSERQSLCHALAVSLTNTKQDSKAASLIEEVLARQPNSPWMLLMRSRISAKVGNPAMALVDLQRAFQLLPHEPRMLNALVRLLREQGDEQAIFAAQHEHERHRTWAIDRLDRWSPAPVASDQAVDRAKSLYLDLMERTVSNWIYREPQIWPDGRVIDSSDENRESGRDIPHEAHTMIGRRRLGHLRWAAEQVLADGVPGDFIETGVWRGGACILLRAVLAAYEVTDRKVIAADSYEGLPSPDPRYESDALTTFNFHERPELAISVDRVRENFSRYGLLDDQVVFLKGWFKDTLPSLKEQRFSLLRLDGDLYSSTMDTLEALYDQVSPGGFVIIDDYGVVIDARRAVLDFRDRHRLTEQMLSIDGDGVFWRKM